MTATKLVHPTIHMNGSSRDALMDGYLNARAMLLAAMGALEESHPNGRDYYPQGPDAVQDAMRQHRDRVMRLQAIIVEVEALALILSESR